MDEKTLTRLHDVLTESLLERLGDPECPPTLYREAIAHLKNNGISVEVDRRQDGAFGSLINTVERAVSAGALDEQLIN